MTAGDWAVAAGVAVGAAGLAGLLRGAPRLLVVLALELLAVRLVPELAPFATVAAMLGVALLGAGLAGRRAPAAAVTAWRLAGAGPGARFLRFGLPGLAAGLGAALAGAALVAAWAGGRVSPI